MAKFISFDYRNMSDCCGSTVCQAMSNGFSVLFSLHFKSWNGLQLLGMSIRQMHLWLVSFCDTLDGKHGNMATRYCIVPLARHPLRKIVEASDSESKESWSSSKPIRNCFLRVWKASIIKKCISSILTISSPNFPKDPSPFGRPTRCSSPVATSTWVLEICFERSFGN